MYPCCNAPLPFPGTTSGQPSVGAPTFGTGIAPSLASVNSEENPDVSKYAHPAGSGTAEAPQPTNPSSIVKFKMWRDARADDGSGRAKGEKLYFDNICALPMYWKMSPEVSSLGPCPTASRPGSLSEALLNARPPPD